MLLFLQKKVTKKSKSIANDEGVSVSDERYGGTPP